MQGGKNIFTNQKLVKLWSNDRKRKAFIQDFKAWGVWFTQPELNLTFYKFDLPDGSRLIALKYLRTPYPNEKPDGDTEPVSCSKHYLQRGAYFNPAAASGYEMADHLKFLKEKLMKEMKNNG